MSTIRKFVVNERDFGISSLRNGDVVEIEGNRFISINGQTSGHRALSTIWLLSEAMLVWKEIKEELASSFPEQGKRIRHLVPGYEKRGGGTIIAKRGETEFLVEHDTWRGGHAGNLSGGDVGRRCTGNNTGWWYMSKEIEILSSELLSSTFSEKLFPEQGMVVWPIGFYEDRGRGTVIAKRGTNTFLVEHDEWTNGYSGGIISSDLGRDPYIPNTGFWYEWGELSTTEPLKNPSPKFNYVTALASTASVIAGKIYKAIDYNGKRNFIRNGFGLSTISGDKVFGIVDSSFSSLRLSTKEEIEAAEAGFDTLKEYTESLEEAKRVAGIKNSAGSVKHFSTPLCTYIEEEEEEEEEEEFPKECAPPSPPEPGIGHKFKIGDLIVGNHLANHYGITIEGWMGRVIKIHPSGRFDAVGERNVRTDRNRKFESLSPERFDLTSSDVRVMVEEEIIPVIVGKTVGNKPMAIAGNSYHQNPVSMKEIPKTKIITIN